MPRYAHGSRKYMARLSQTWTSAAPSSNVGLPQSPIKGGRHLVSMPIPTTALRKRLSWYKLCGILAYYDLDPAQILLCAGSFFAVSVIVSEIHCSQYRVHDILCGLELPVRQALHALRQYLYISGSPVHIITGAK